MANRVNVLIVEDDDDCGETVNAILRKNGFGVRLVSSRDDAMFALSVYLYDVILMDVSMPGMTIDEFMARSAAFRTATVVLMSAATVVEHEAARLGIRHFLKKPFEPDGLLDLIYGIVPKKVTGRIVNKTNSSN